MTESKKINNGRRRRRTNEEEEAPRTTMVNGALGFKWAERRSDPAYKPDP